MDTWKKIFRFLFSMNFWGYGLFWSWNLIFLAFMGFGFLPQMLPELIESVRQGWTPPTFLILALVQMAIPVMAVILGATLLRRSPGKLLALGYGVEGPLMVLLLIRFFLIRQSTAATTFLLTVGFVGIAVLLWQLLDRRVEERSLPVRYTRLAGLTLLLFGGVYAGIWITFYLIPISTQLPEMARQMLSSLWETILNLEWKTLAMLPVAFLGTLLVFYTATLFVAMPIAVPLIYVHQWWQGLKAIASKQGKFIPLLSSGLVLTLLLVALVLTNQQPQTQAYSLLQDKPANLQDAEALYQKENLIREGLVNAYLSPMRYIGSVGEMGHIQDLYRGLMDVTEAQAAAVERAYSVVARPLLYEPMYTADINRNISDWWLNQALQREPQEAAQLYADFFDVPILQGERDELVAAARSNWSGEQALTNWQAVDEREVRLTRQEVNVREHGDWAEVEIYEVYQNETTRRQEVVYYFSLPESAVLTGLWLGTSSNRAARDTFQVAPRGAAQQVYREQVRLNIDPALLEQVGPSQYRLRAFPVEPARWTWEEGKTSTLERGPEMHLWLTYTTLAEGDSWPLPYLAEHRNVFWNKSSVRLLNGEPMEVAADRWLPEAVAASQPVIAQAHQVTFGDGQVVQIVPEAVQAIPPLPEDLRLAVVLDRSRSMVAYSESAKETLIALNTLSPDADVYLTASQYRGEQASQAKLADLVQGDVLYFGGQNAAELLAQFAALNYGKRYDAIFVITDGTGFKMGGEEIQVSVPSVPVWMIHLDGQFPLGYDDASLSAIQASGGGVAADWQTARDRLAVSLQGQDSPSTAIGRDVLDGYHWATIPAGQESPAVADIQIHPLVSAFAKLAARRVILDATYRSRGSITQVETLDALHAVATANGIVTPYSSMIVLINAAQQKRLENLSAADDRFAREGEEIGETQPFQVTGVPEPHEWLLIGLAVLLLGWYAWDRQKRLDAARM